MQSIFQERLIFATYLPRETYFYNPSHQTARLPGRFAPLIAIYCYPCIWISWAGQKLVYSIKLSWSKAGLLEKWSRPEFWSHCVSVLLLNFITNWNLIWNQIFSFFFLSLLKSLIPMWSPVACVWVGGHWPVAIQSGDLWYSSSLPPASWPLARIHHKSTASTIGQLLGVWRNVCPFWSLEIGSVPFHPWTVLGSGLGQTRISCVGYSSACSADWVLQFSVSCLVKHILMESPIQ